MCGDIIIMIEENVVMYFRLPLKVAGGYRVKVTTTLPYSYHMSLRVYRFKKYKKIGRVPSLFLRYLTSKFE